VLNGIDKSGPCAPSETDWSDTVRQIRAGDPAGEEKLYRHLESGARIFFRRRLRTEDVDDQVHNLFVVLVEAIRRGDLREPAKLMGFVRTVLHRQLGLEISRTIRAREASIDLESAGELMNAAPSPEQRAAEEEKVDLMKRALRKMSERDFEVLTRFYLHEQPAERIRKEMGLTGTQFDLLKSRAKARLVKAIKSTMSRTLFNRESR
jgi:RNA polymerase sigma factor (sigma-70 family)